jgi:predicted phosphoribosyltransferase
MVNLWGDWDRVQFRDRREAGQLLAKKLASLRGRKDVIVLGVPRGGVVVASEIAKALGAPLDVYIAHKIGAPYNPELAIGAVAEDGEPFLDEFVAGQLGVSEHYLAEETARQRTEIQRRLAQFRGDRPPPSLAGQTVILADDGVATGATTLAALRALRQQTPAQLILAVPVGPPETMDRLRQEVDQVVCLATPEPFWAVGRFYLVFDQTSDQEVKALLDEAAARSAK